jgi:SAM-dependent methyltransferase
MIIPIPGLLHDETFDEQLPHYVRKRSRQYWTPVSVAARAAATFAVMGAKRILDVGCGPGKFCVVVGCLRPELRVHGVEQRPRLVRVGRRLARHFDAPNVEFWAGDATRLSWDQYDGFYFFNPFAESIFGDADRFDDSVSFSTMRFGVELLRAESKLAQARPGTVVITYHGLGGVIPSTYELVSDDHAGSDRVRTWVQRATRPAAWAWFETSSAVLRVSRNHMHEALASLICGESDGGLFTRNQALTTPTGAHMSGGSLGRVLTLRRPVRR